MPAVAMTAAETGHLVLGTLHTNSAAQSIDRMVDVFPPHQQQQIRIQLASVLQGIVAQRLIPMVGGGRIAAAEILTAQLVKRPLDIHELLGHLGLAEHRHKFPGQLSGGQQQRCAIARALVKGSDVLLADEPTGALDRHTSQQMLEVLDEVHRRYGATLIMVTHNEAITAMADQVVELSDGRVVRDELNPHPVPAKDLDW